MEVDDGSRQGARDWWRSQGGLDNLAPAGRSLANEGRNKVGTRGFEQVRHSAAPRENVRTEKEAPSGKRQRFFSSARSHAAPLFESTL